MKCENCGELITMEEYLAVSIMVTALCTICKSLSKKQRHQRFINSINKK